MGEKDVISGLRLDDINDHFDFDVQNDQSFSWNKYKMIGR